MKTDSLVRAKLDKWNNKISNKKYLENKSVYDNPKYFNQETGYENWPGENGDPNTDGFKNGEYEEVYLHKGNQIDRYGGNNGTFFGEVGTPLEKRAMSPSSDFSRYNCYEVLKDIPFRKGEIAPWFGQSGGGIQYKLDPIFESLIKRQLLRNEELIDCLIRLKHLVRK